MILHERNTVNPFSLSFPSNEVQYLITIGESVDCQFYRAFVSRAKNILQTSIWTPYLRISVQPFSPTTTIHLVASKTRNYQARLNYSYRDIHVRFIHPRCNSLLTGIPNVHFTLAFLFSLLLSHLKLLINIQRGQSGPLLWNFSIPYARFSYVWMVICGSIEPN